MSEQAEPSVSSARTPNGVRRKLNSISPLVAAAPVLPTALLAMIFFGAGAFKSLGAFAIPVAIGLAVALTVLVAGLKYLQWRRLDFWFDDAGDLRIDSGVISRNERKLALSRLQAVDVEQPLVARLVGLATIKIEVAGAGETKAVLSFLTKSDAEQLRREILSRSAGEAHEDAIAAPRSESETVIARVAMGELVWSLVLRTSTAGLLLLTVVIAVVTYWSEGFGGLLLLPITGGIPILMVATEFAALYGFTISQAGTGLRLRHGLLKTQAQFVPPGRVQAVDFLEPLLWRRAGWVRIRLTVAGMGGGSSDGGGQSASRSVLLPVAKWDEALAIFARIMPGVDLAAIDLQSAPRIARWRSPVQGSRLAVGWNGEVFVTRRGMITRYFSVVPHARTQSVRVTQGPYQRALGLASMWVDVPPGPVSIGALQQPAEHARNIAQAQAQRAQVARSTETPTRLPD